MSQVRYAEAGAAHQPSPSIWKDCPGERLMRDGVGLYFHEDFLSSAVSATFVADMTIASGLFAFSGDAATVVTMKTGELGGWIDIETDGDNDDAWAIFTEPVARFVINSGRKVWLEAHFEIGDADIGQGFFFGLAEEAALADIIVDGTAALIGESYIGFRILTGEDAIDFAYKLNGGTEVIVTSDVTNDSIVPDNAALADDTPFKLGMRFDGKETVQIFVNGTKIHELTLSASIFPDNVDMAVIMALKTDGAADSAAIDWIRLGHQRIV